MATTRFNQSPLAAHPAARGQSYMPATPPPMGQRAAPRTPAPTYAPRSRVSPPKQKNYVSSRSPQKKAPAPQRRSHRRSAPEGPSFWDRILCQGTDGFKMKNLSAALGWSGGEGDAKSRRYHRTLSFETIDEWEGGPHAATNYRRGRPDDSPAEDLNIQIRDLFPCLADLWDFFGCPKKPLRRALAAPRLANKGPQMETVCLECGHLLESHPLPPGVERELRNQVDLPWHPTTFPGGENMEPTKASQFQGYRDWNIDDTAVVPHAQHTAEKIPLPAIAAGPQRTFMNAPGYTQGGDQWMDNDFLPLDPTGRVELPDFKAGSDAGSA